MFKCYKKIALVLLLLGSGFALYAQSPQESEKQQQLQLQNLERFIEDCGDKQPKERQKAEAMHVEISRQLGLKSPYSNAFLNKEEEQAAMSKTLNPEEYDKWKNEQVKKPND